MGLALGVLAMYELYTRPVTSTKPPTAEKSKQQESTTETKAAASKTPPPAPPSKPVSVPLPPISRWLPASLAFGSLVFGLHTFLADSGTMLAWTWTGYPIKGPMPHLHGSIVLLAQAVGVLLFVALWRTPLPLPPTSEPSTANAVGPALAESAAFTLLGSPLWYAVGTAGAYVLYAYKDWTGCFGGAVFAVFLMSVIPLAFQRTAAAVETRGAAMVFFTAWLAAALLDFFHVLTVAYAFVSGMLGEVAIPLTSSAKVPGGQYLRERTDV
jgi:hypothetical protein